MGTNMLLTGFYKDYRKGWHKAGSDTGHEAFRQNSTLAAVVKLCTGSVPGNTGVKTIISYNYDDLLGPDLLVHIIWERGKTSGRAYLPAGEKWINAWNPSICPNLNPLKHGELIIPLIRNNLSSHLPR